MHTPLRHLAVTLALTILALAGAGLAGGSTGYEMLIVAMGWPHVILGFVFFFRKALRGDPGARAQFAFLSLATASFWTLHRAFDLTALIFVYFLYHAFRDEVAVYLSQQSRYRTAISPYVVTGIIPLTLALLLVAAPPDFRQDLRRMELSSARIHSDGWTLFPFRPVPDSRGRAFYFYLISPGSPEVPKFIAEGEANTAAAAVMRVDDRRWHEDVALSFVPDYSGQTESPRPTSPDSWTVALTGGHRVGQVFTAAEDGLSGIWLRTRTPPGFEGERNFILHVASPPLLPLESYWTTIRWALGVGVLAILLWRVLPGLPNSAANRQLWTYVAIFSAIFVLTQQGLKYGSGAGYAMPMIFQFVVVFHYFRWYVVSFDKLRVRAADARPFAMKVAGLHLASFFFVCWYYLWNAPPPLRYAFDYSWFLYVLVLHVTFSFSPKIPKLSS